MSAISSMGSSASMSVSGMSTATSSMSAGQLGSAQSLTASTGQNSAMSVMMNSQASTVLNSFQSALAGEDSLKMMMAMLILEALMGGDKDKKENESSLAALAMLGAAAGSQTSGAFMSSYSSISQIDSSTVAGMNQQLAGSAAYVGQASASAGSALNVMG